VIGQIREVGIGGAKYGVDLYRRLHAGAAPSTLVLGYGNTSMGAFEHLRAEQIPFTVLGRDQTVPAELRDRLAGAGLVVNGAETPGSTEYILTAEQTGTHLPAGSVVIDLIGGSPARRSPVEAFEWTTFLPQIHFESGGRYFAGLWGWDMYYSMHDTAKEYSRRISSVLNRTPVYAKSLDAFADDYAYAKQLDH
jgi:alanine dehydrogenase